MKISKKSDLNFENIYFKELAQSEDDRKKLLDIVEKIRTSPEEIKSLLKSGEHDRLYNDLFEDQLIDRKQFDELISEGVDLYKVVRGFDYDEYENAGENQSEAKSLEMQGRICMVKGDLDGARIYFDKAIEKSWNRYHFFDGSKLCEPDFVHYGTTLYQELAHKFQKEDNSDEWLTCIAMSLTFKDPDHPMNTSDETHKRAQRYEENEFVHFLELERKNEQLEKEIERRKAAEQANQNIVRQYAHTLGNTLFPETIYSIAKSLKGHGKFRKESLILRQAYHAEILVRHQAELLRVQHGAGDNFEEFQRLIYQDRLPEDRPDAAVTVTDILNYATERVVARLLNQNDSKLKNVREQLVKTSGMELEALRNSFEEQVFFEPQQTALEWVNQNVGHTKIGELSPLWKKIRLRKDGYAHALLQGDHWGELLLNAFKYANHTKKDFLTLRFEELEVADHKWLRMIWENPSQEDEKIESVEVSEKAEDYGKAQKETVRNYGEGLKGIEANLRQLSDTEDENLLLKYGLKNGNFIATLNYRSDMLVPYEMKNPDLVKNYFQRKREAKEKT